LSADLRLVLVAGQADEDLVRARCVVVIDVFRATTTMLSALEAGAKGIYAVSGVEEARALRERKPRMLLAGERGGLPLAGFDLGNSPLEMTPGRVAGRTLVLTTTNGTLATERSRSGSQVYAACLRNADAAAREAVSTGLDVTLVCAGTEGRLSIEDLYAAGIVAARLSLEGYALDDGASAAAILAGTEVSTVVNERTCRHYRTLMGLGLSDDINYCLELNCSSAVPSLVHGEEVPLFALD
jgi:2-phosphosulfolactate phosphatase